MSPSGNRRAPEPLPEAVQGDLFELWQQHLPESAQLPQSQKLPVAPASDLLAGGAQGSSAGGGISVDGEGAAQGGVVAELLAPPPLVFQRSARARHYRLTLRRDGTALVTIPARGSQRAAEQFAAQHAQWLERARERQAQRPQAAGTWELGTAVLWRGQLCEIRVASAAELGSAKWRVQLSLGGELFRVARLDGNLRPSLEAQFARLARAELPPRTQELAAQAQRVWAARGEPPEAPSIARALASRLGFSRAADAVAPASLPLVRVVVRDQRSRWGSCSGRGTISLNWRLVQTPDFVRDYIIYHELMHLREMNHSPRFWARVAEVCPDWERAERWLKQNGSLLLGS